MDIEFVDAPPRRKSGRGDRGKWADFFDALRENPGQWAVIPQPYTDSSVVPRIKRGRYQGCGAGEFEATSRKRDDGRFDIYVRYVGGDQ